MLLQHPQMPSLLAMQAGLARALGSLLQLGLSLEVGETLLCQHATAGTCTQNDFASEMHTLCLQSLSLRLSNCRPEVCSGGVSLTPGTGMLVCAAAANR